MDVVERLRGAFMNCEKLQRHIRFLYTKGSLYKVYNGNLLYHGCVPLNEDGSFQEVEIYGKKFSGKALYDEIVGSGQAFFKHQLHTGRHFHA